MKTKSIFIVSFLALMGVILVLTTIIYYLPKNSDNTELQIAKDSITKLHIIIDYQEDVNTNLVTLNYRTSIYIRSLENEIEADTIQWCDSIIN